MNDDINASPTNDINSRPFTFSNDIGGGSNSDPNLNIGQMQNTDYSQNTNHL